MRDFNICISCYTVFQTHLFPFLSVPSYMYLSLHPPPTSNLTSNLSSPNLLLSHLFPYTFHLISLPPLSNVKLKTPRLQNVTAIRHFLSLSFFLSPHSLFSLSSPYLPSPFSEFSFHICTSLQMEKHILTNFLFPRKQDCREVDTLTEM